MSELVLYGHPDSGHACKVALALALAGLSHRAQFIDIWAPPETRDPAFLAASPLAEVPLLVIDGAGFTQSGAILLEIATRFGVLGGDSAAGRTRARQVLMWEANRIGLCLPQILSHAKGAPMAPGLTEALPWLTDRFHTDSANFTRLLGDAPFFHGESPGIGDCAVWGYAQWIEEAGLAATPPIAAWRDRMRALPGMASPEAFFPVPD